MPSTIHPLWISLLVLVCYSGCAVAFGAGNIPDYGFLEGKAYRHGDIEDILAEMMIRAVSSDTSNVFDFVKKVAGMGSEKFSGLNVKRTYFGNWLRDYSQAVDVGTLSKGLDVGTIRILIWILGFMSFGYATDEFEVTEERLGVYRPEEHIDNPKDYADNIDARQYDRRLRGPVDPRELEVDPRTGIKNYIANEQGGWATSTRYIRESLTKAIGLGRRGKDNERDMFEALRLLGQSLHTLEDLGAHSNWVELALIELGYNQVFPQVGGNTQISVQGSGKRVWPLVTGTFGGTDFIHSLLGEATDKLSQTSLTDLNAAVTDAELKNTTDTFDKLKGLLSMLPSSDATKNLIGLQQSGQNLAGKGKQFHLQGMQGSGQAISPQDIAKEIYPILEFRDKLMKSITEAMEMIPGLNAAIDEITQTLTVYVLSLVQPFIKPIMQLVSENVSKGSHLVMTDENQYLVWNDNNSSDPTHSMLAKDHFSCYLNDPAGQIAKVIVRHAVTQVVNAWSDNSVDINRSIDSIVECFCHPALLNRNSRLHMDMFAVVRDWIEGLPSDKKERILEGLTKEGVREGRHHDDEKRQAEEQAGGHGHSHAALPLTTQRPDLQIAGFNIPQGVIGQGAAAFGFQDPTALFGRVVENREVGDNGYTQRASYTTEESYGTSSYRQTEQTSYSQVESPSYRQNTGENASYYGEQFERSTQYSSRGRGDDDDESYGQREDSYGGSRYQQQTYGQREESYGTSSYQQRDTTYDQEDSYETTTYRQRDETISYRQREEEPSYQRDEESTYQREEQSYVQRDEEPSYGERENEYSRDFEESSVQESFENLNVRDDEYEREEIESRQYEDSTEEYSEY